MGETVTGQPRPGDLIAGKYQVEQVLGAGGMGVVVAARHVALKQHVAVKFLLPAALRFPDAAARFLREAQAAVAIRSEHVARVLDVGTLESGAPYMVMEYLAGTDLRKLLQQRGALAVVEAVDFVLQASEAIAEAHTLGIVHRDLKPANIFLTHRADGSSLVKVLDFGLSKMPSQEGGAERGLTATDVVAGSPEYMSPEQVRSLKNVDGRTDIWALGVVLYELLTGRRPFPGPTAAAVCASVAADAPAPVRSHRADIPEGLERVIGACLEKDPNRRIGTMGELAAALAPFAAAQSAASIERVGRLSPGAAGGRGSVSDLGMGATGPGAGGAMGTGATSAGAPRDFQDGTITMPRANRPSMEGAPVGRAPGVRNSSPGAGVTAPMTGLPGTAMAGLPGTPAPMTGFSGADAPPTGSLDTAPTGPSGHLEGWGQTRQSRAPARRGPMVAVVGALGAVAITVGIVVWQVAGAGDGGSPAGASGEVPVKGVVASGDPGVSATVGAPAVTPAEPLAPSGAPATTVSAAPATSAAASPATTGAPSASARVASPTAVTSVKPPPKAKVSRPAPAKTAGSVLDQPL